jgi:hypothetical protein
MVDPLLVGLDVAVEHRAVRGDSEPVRRAVCVDPEVGMLLAGRDESPHSLREHFRPATR